MNKNKKELASAHLKWRKTRTNRFVPQPTIHFNLNQNEINVYTRDYSGFKPLVHCFISCVYWQPIPQHKNGQNICAIQKTARNSVPYTVESRYTVPCLQRILHYNFLFPGLDFTEWKILSPDTTYYRYNVHFPTPLGVLVGRLG